MLCYNVSNCDCCGKMSIDYDDNLLKIENILLNDLIQLEKPIMFGNVVVLVIVVVNNFIILKNQLKYYFIGYIMMEMLPGNF